MFDNLLLKQLPSILGNRYAIATREINEAVVRHNRNGYCDLLSFDSGHRHSITSQEYFR